ncbi:hypothetical protein VTN00DRAFT_6035 [Thermoascus crustaceus]|uniref:uncharacterized protein n=1 Tax=Thermoascus crustaceus TaxID=5088 RepID=UPI0037439B46
MVCPLLRRQIAAQAAWFLTNTANGTYIPGAKVYLETCLLIAETRFFVCDPVREKWIRYCRETESLRRAKVSMQYPTGPGGPMKINNEHCFPQRRRSRGHMHSNSSTAKSASVERPSSAEVLPDASRFENLKIRGTSKASAEPGLSSDGAEDTPSSSQTTPQTANERRKRPASTLDYSTTEQAAEIGIGWNYVPPKMLPKPAEGPNEFDRGLLPSRERKVPFNPESDDVSRRASLGNSNHNSNGCNTAAATPPRRCGSQTYTPRQKRQHVYHNAPSQHHDAIRSSGPLRGDGISVTSGHTTCEGMFLQPETHPITEEQLINEVRGIYAGLVMVEKKCMEIDKQQSQTKSELEDVQWQALIALHRTLLHEHHDFFLASQHPSAGPVLRKLAEKYAMPARMWRYGIHSFLELLRHRLPDSLEHMLTFIYLAYSMMTLLLESVPTFEETWIECLGDLARYRMAVEEADMRDREVWAGVARYWYNKAADKSPDVGRIQHHLAVLARPNIVQQLFYYTKSLVSITPFPSASDSILLLFNPLLDPSRAVNNRHPPLATAFVSAHGVLFTKGSVDRFIKLVDEFLSLLDNYIGRVGALFREQGVYIASANYAAIFEYGQTNAIMPDMFDHQKIKAVSFQTTYESAQRFWGNLDNTSCSESRLISQVDSATSGDVQFSNSIQIISYGSYLAFSTLAIILRRIGDKNVLPHVHISLAFLWSLALNPKSMKYIQTEVPWAQIAVFLSTLIRRDTDVAKVESDEFPRSESGTMQQLPEDFLIRGQAWSQLYYPDRFFEDSIVDDEERSIELPSIVVPRTHRCLWLGVRIATFKRWITYNYETKHFSATPLAFELENAAREAYPFDCTSKTLSPELRDSDAKMTDKAAYCVSFLTKALCGRMPRSSLSALWKIVTMRSEVFSRGFPCRDIPDVHTYTISTMLRVILLRRLPSLESAYWTVCLEAAFPPLRGEM